MNINNRLSTGLSSLAIMAATSMPMISHAENGVRNSHFELKMVTEETVSQGGGCPALSVGLRATGLATLGAFTATGTHCSSPESNGNTTISDGRMVFTYDGGDQVNVAYSLTAVPLQVPSIVKVTGTYTITGGTGRFANVSGVGVVNGLDQVMLEQGRIGPGHITAEGTISY